MVNGAHTTSTTHDDSGGGDGGRPLTFHEHARSVPGRSNVRRPCRARVRFPELVNQTAAAAVEHYTCTQEFRPDICRISVCECECSRGEMRRV